MYLHRSPDRRREDSPAADPERLRRLRRYEELDRQLLLERGPKGKPLDDDDEEGDSPRGDNWQQKSGHSPGGWSPEQHSRRDREETPSAPQVSGFSSSFSFSGSQPSGFGGSNFGFGDSRQVPSTSGQSNSGQSDYWSHKRRGNWH